MHHGISLFGGLNSAKFIPLLVGKFQEGVRRFLEFLFYLFIATQLLGAFYYRGGSFYQVQVLALIKYQFLFIRARSGFASLGKDKGYLGKTITVKIGNRKGIIEKIAPYIKSALIYHFTYFPDLFNRTIARM